MKKIPFYKTMQQTVVGKSGIPQQRIQSALVLVAGPPVDLKVDEPRRWGGGVNGRPPPHLAGGRLGIGDSQKLVDRQAVGRFPIGNL